MGTDELVREYGKEKIGASRNERLERDGSVIQDFTLVLVDGILYYPHVEMVLPKMETQCLK